MQELRGNVLVDVTPELEEAVSNQPSICDIDEIATQLEACSSILKEIFIAIKGQIPKKPVTYKDTNRADCPICGATVRGIKEPFGDWCSRCGQKLDWGRQ